MNEMRTHVHISIFVMMCRFDVVEAKGCAKGCAERQPAANEDARRREPAGVAVLIERVS
jgi:hypothetical protein